MRTLIRAIFSPLTILGAIGFGLLLFGAVVVGLNFIKPEAPAGPLPTPILNVIPAPTATLIPATTAPTAVPTATSPAPPTPPPGTITVGGYVQITGTGGDGLRVRTDPNLQGQVVFIALESEVFQVTDGPRDADGYTWYYLTAPFDSSHHGWAVVNYLQVVQNP